MPGVGEGIWGAEGGSESVVSGSLDGARDGRTKIKRLRVDTDVLEDIVGTAFTTPRVDGGLMSPIGSVGVRGHGRRNAILQV